MAYHGNHRMEFGRGFEGAHLRWNLRAPGVHRRLLGWACLGMVVLGSLAASAAPKKKDKPTEPPAAAESSAGEEPGSDWSEKPTAPARGAKDPELGEPPAPRAAESRERPSPLTPPAEEMPARPSLEAEDHGKLLADLVALRARVQALNAALYESKLRISLEADGDEVRIASLTVTVDGGIVYTAPDKFVGAEEAVVYEHAVAPGRHVIGIEVERFDPQARSYRVWQATRYAVEVPEKRTLSARVELEDDSSMEDPTSGRYRTRASMRVEVLEP